MSGVLIDRMFFFQAEDGIRYLVRSRGLGDVYKRQTPHHAGPFESEAEIKGPVPSARSSVRMPPEKHWSCLLYTSDAADERSSVDLGGRRIIKKKNRVEHYVLDIINIKTHTSRHAT